MYQKAKQWLRRQLFGDRKCTKLSAAHVGVGGKLGSAVHTVVVEKVTEDHIDIFFDELFAACNDDAEALGGVQKYVLLAYFERDAKAGARYAFRLECGDNSDDSDSFDSEPASKAGIIAQQMRHNEVIMRSSVASTQTVINTLQRTVARQAETIEHMQSKHIELIELVEDLKSQRHIRDLETSGQEFKQKAFQDAYDKVMLLAPTVINKFAGQKLLPEKTTPQAAMLQQFAKSLSEEQMLQFQSILRPEQSITLLELYSSVQGADSSSNGVKG